MHRLETGTQDLGTGPERHVPGSKSREVHLGQLTGRTALVTGGSTGIGLATATRFVAEGAEVIITGRWQADLDRPYAAVAARGTGRSADL